MNWTSPALDDLIRTILSAGPYAGNAVDLILCETERARRLALDGAAPSQAAQSLAFAAAAAAAAGLAGRQAADPGVDGQVHLNWSENGTGHSLPVPPGERVLTLGEWLLGWSAAVMSRDALSALTLCSAEILLPATQAQGETGAVWGPFCGLLAAATTNRASLPEWMAALHAALERQAVLLPPGAFDDRVAPAMAVIDALQIRDRTGIEKAVERAVTAHLATFADRELVADPARAWPPEICALLCLMLDEGILDAPTVSHLLAPLPQAVGQVVQGGLRPAHALADVVWPLAAILSADEARWFLDLRGMPRDLRRHVIETDASGRLIASYTASGALAPRGRARFLMVETPEAAGDTPIAVDAAELLALAELYGGSVQTAREAVDCVEAALARVPTGAEQVPKETLTSGVGRAMLLDEPGRLRKARMQAYRKGMAEALEESPPATPPTSPLSHSPGPNLMQAMESSTQLLASAVEPILREMVDTDDVTWLETLRPMPDEFALIFTPEAAEAARTAWQTLPPPGPPDAAQYTEIEIFAAPGGVFRSGNVLSERFPGKYQGIADKLNPHRVWIAWRYVTGADGAGLSLDGLVWTGTRWVWLPKPWRLFEPV